MGDPKDTRYPYPPSRPGGQPGAARPQPGAPRAQPTAPAPQPPAGRAGKDASRGRIVHDARGNAVWDWLKETGRNAIESTSRLLRKLEMPELKVEDKKDEELRIESDRDPGGGYDPYNQGNRGRK
jgi:hypothetical protein